MSTKKTPLKLKVNGKWNRVYKVVVEGEEKELRQGDIVNVKTKEEADRLGNLKSLSGEALFIFVGGVVEDGENTQGSQSK